MTQYRKDDPKSVCALFGAIAPRYDLTNSVLSLGLHHLWNRRLAATTFDPACAAPLLDLCCGTGEISWCYLKKQRQSQELFLIDFCPEMISLAQQRAKKLGFETHHCLTFTVGDAQAIPLPDNSISAIAIAYGIRNLPSRSSCLRELHRILIPGGRVGILELTRPKQRLLASLHGLYLRYLLPRLGRLCNANQEAYDYLSTTVADFIEPQHLLAEIEQADLTMAQATPLSGGIAHLFSCQKAR